jgi:hypothetical protein
MLCMHMTQASPAARQGNDSSGVGDRGQPPGEAVLEACLGTGMPVCAEGGQERQLWALLCVRVYHTECLLEADWPCAAGGQTIHSRHGRCIPLLQLSGCVCRRQQLVSSWLTAPSMSCCTAVIRVALHTGCCAKAQQPMLFIAVMSSHET